MSATYDPSLRGKCKQLAEAAVAEDPTLRLVRGWYFEPAWGREDQHWWCERPNGRIVDPSAGQFSSLGQPGLYREFEGVLECEMCGREFPEDEAYPTGNSHMVCSDRCFGRMVGF